MRGFPFAVKTLGAFAMPGGLLVLGALVFLRPRMLPDWSLPLVQAYAYLVIGAGLLLGWFLQRSRVVLALLVLALADRALLHFPIPEEAAGGIGRTVFNAVALLLPMNLLALSLITDRAIRTRAETVRLSMILGQVGLVTWLCLPGQAEVAAALATDFVAPRYAGWIPMPQPALLAFGVAFVLQGVRFIIAKDPVEKGFFWTLVAAFIAVLGSRAGWSPTNYLATAGLILILAMYEADRRLASYDRLTRVASRRAFDQALFNLRGRYAVAMVDIDRFKGVNARYGVRVGNKLLQRVAGTIVGLFNGNAFRYEGGTFAVIFPGQSVGEALPRLETLREAVERMKFVRRHGSPVAPPALAGESSPEQDLSVTISVGVAERDERKPTPLAVVKAAEKALHRAKFGGRNRVKGDPAGPTEQAGWVPQRGS